MRIKDIVFEAKWQIFSYQMPEVVQESSLTQPLLLIEPGPVTLTYTLVPGGTKRGKAKLWWIP